MKTYIALTYWNPIKAERRFVPAGLSFGVYDADVGFHDHIGGATTTGDVLDLDLHGWGLEGRPDLFFKLKTRAFRIDLVTEALLRPEHDAQGHPVLDLPERQWDSRKHGPGHVFESVEPARGLGEADDPLQIHLESGRAWYRMTWWNRLADIDGDSIPGEHRPVPPGVSFHVEDRDGRHVGRGRVVDGGRLYVPIWRADTDEVSLHLDSDFDTPLVIDLRSEQIVAADGRRGGGEHATFTRWEQGWPVLRAGGPGQRFSRVRAGRVGSSDSPVELDLSAEPWTRGNVVRTLVDGNEVYLAMVEAMREAQHSIHLTAWDFDPSVWVDRLNPDASSSTRTLEDLLLDLVEQRPGLHIRVLNWPETFKEDIDREMVNRIENDQRNRDGRFEVVLDNPNPITRSHHQKTLVVDEKIAFCGGIDFAWGRWDTGDHRPHVYRQEGRKMREPKQGTEDDESWFPWHDVHLGVQGPVVGAVSHNFRTRWHHAAGEDLGPATAPRAIPGGVPAAACRTWPSSVPGADNSHVDENGIQVAWLRAIGAARRTIFVENQYLFSRRIAKALTQRVLWARDNGVDDFRVIVILPSYFAKPPPAAPKMHFIQERCTRILKNADPDRQHVRLWTLRTWDEERNKYLGVYIHSKVLMVDDEWMTVGSANAGNRSMGYDTEMNISVKDPDTVSSLRHRLMSEHARCEIPLDPTAASDFMETIAKANGNALEIFEDSDGEDVAGLGEPLERRLFPYRTDKRGMDFPIPAFLL